MKLEFDTKAIKEYFEKNKNAFFYLVAILFIVLVGFSVFTVLTLKADSGVLGTGIKKTNEALINFDKTYLEELKNKKSPTQVNQSGGRNPFLSF